MSFRCSAGNALRSHKKPMVVGRRIQPVPGDAGFSLQFNAAVIWAFRLRKAFILNAGLTIVVERLAAPNRTRVIWSVRVKLFGFASRRECQRTEATV